jgi:hypothetical protein
MTRALSSVCLVVMLVVGGSAHAGKKEKIAILGLEVFSGSAGVDADSTRVAQELTVGLRTRPKADKGPYQFASQSEKELIDEKLMNDCQAEDPKCMTVIAKNLGTDYLMYGKIEKKSLGSQVGYQISLKLLRAQTQTVTNWTDFIPMSEANGPKLADWARKGYKKLTNDTNDGTLVVKANVDRGTILLNNVEQGNIVNNRGEVPNLADGKYKLAIEAKGYQRWEADEQITIRGGETTTQEATLKEVKGEVPTKLCDPSVSTCENTVTDAPSTAKWKVMMIAGLVVAGGSTGLLVFSNSQIHSAELGLCSGSHDKAHDPTCMKTGNQSDLLKQGDRYQTASYVAGGLIVAGVTVGAIGLIKGFIVTGSKEKQAAGNTTVGQRQRKRSSFEVTPVVGPQGAGATLRFDW